MIISHSAFAVCHRERKEYQDWSSKCESYSAAATAAGAVGGGFALFTFGISMAPAAALIPVAINACRIKDEKKLNLTNCENIEAETARLSQEQAQKVIDAQTNKLTNINAINEKYRQKKEWVVRDYEIMGQRFTENFLREGWDTESAESQEFIRTTLKRFNDERDEKLKQNEEQRVEELKNV